MFKTPRRVRGSSISGCGVSIEDDKENARAHTGVAGVGKGKDGNAAEGHMEKPKQLSGKKRGGDDIEKQKAFTGSYFQVTVLFV